MIKADFVIIGAGIAGASVAYELSKHGKVIILERESQPGYHTTGRSAAVLETTYGQGDPIIYALAQIGGKFLNNPPEGFTDHPLLLPRGMLYIAQKNDKEKVIAHYEKIKKVTDDVQLVENEKIKELAPILNDEYNSLAVYLKNELADIDVHALHEGYLKGAKARNCELYSDAEVININHQENNWSVKTAAGEFSAPVIINAAGAWVDEVARMAGVKEIGITPMRRTMVVINPPEGCGDINKMPMINELVDTFYFKPDAGKIIISPCDKTPSEPCDAQPEEIDVAYAAHYFEQCTGHEVRNVEHKWAGLRNRTKDGYPAVGFAPDAKGFFWLAGQEGIGIMTSPSLSRLAASMVLGDDIPSDLKEIGIDEAGLNVARFFK
ncbi:MAG: FAD-binding oxidoreductase [Emcibacteraceae bacterium]|nr:FAD-binding oxidoreductase [Emcibacteraceae bacterium]MDG1997225.1 FAD-binding oxidoreductase [Emcibacteraceae bacterium]